MSNESRNSGLSKDTVTAEPEHEDIPPEMAEALSTLPETQRKEMTRMVAAGVSMISRTSPEVEIAKKITPEHISSILNAEEKGMEYTYKENQHRMLFFGFVLFLVIVAIVIIIILLKDNNPEAMTQILTALISAALGAAGGYGIGVQKRKDD